MLHLVLCIITIAVCGGQYNKYIKHFEPLTYDSEEIQYRLVQQKWSNKSNPFVNIKFHAHGRHFHLKLARDSSIFAQNLQVDSPAGVFQQFDTSHVYEGTLWGEANTRAYGSIRNGVFDGTVHTEQGAYYIERSNKYFAVAEEISLGFHSLIYHERDITEKLKDFGGCGATDDVSEWMRGISHSAIEGMKIRDRENESAHRSKRAVPKKRACSLYIQTDTFLWDHIYSREKDALKTREEIVALIAQHVQAVNRIYQNASFNAVQGIKFVVQRITINDSRACAGADNPFCAGNISVSDFLDRHSKIKYDGYCLAYIFTYRDFSGILGLAWVASPLGASGGACEQYKSYKNIDDGSPTKRSLNTGTITLNNYNTTVPPKISHIMFAHEIGHNFGSPHDYPDKCKPGGAEGNYLMFAGSTSGDRPNNDRFSHCSVGNISAVLLDLFSGASGKHQCLTEDISAFCGNKITEGNEECDCGYDEDDCNYQCCFPRNSSNQCTLHPGAECSSHDGPCCDENCQFENAGKYCRLESECYYESICDGKSAMCPPSPLKPDFTDCNEETRVCNGGECVGSICLRDNMEECFLGNSSTPENLCEQACQDNGKPLTCKSRMDDDNNHIKLRPGAPCNNFKGYCDILQICRPVDAEGSLSRIKNMTFDQTTPSAKGNDGIAAAVCATLLFGIGTLLSILVN